MGARRWVVQRTDASKLGVLVVGLGEDLHALAEGRVFVSGRRVSCAETLLRPGDVVRIAQPDRRVANVTVLDRRGGLAVILKGPGVPTEPDRSGAGTSVVEVGARLLGVSRRDVHAGSRLDVGVSGLVLVATTRSGCRHLQELTASGAITKRYVAIATRPPPDSAGKWRFAVRHGRRTRAAVTRYLAVAVAPPSPASDSPARSPLEPALLVLSPETGRWHQLRLHAAQAGSPLLGDRRHGGPCEVCSPDGCVTAIRRVALDAAVVELVDEQGRRWVVDSGGAPDLRDLWQHVGGVAEDFDGAIRAYTSARR
jgi:23S rRNA pseudouridine955/2504/2580 synthase/23S rRNA pseudouridine1911/1915/1917 synthase